MTQEQIFAALWALAPVAGFKTYSRRLQHWEDVPQDGMPALFQRQGKQAHTHPSRDATRIEAEVDWTIYAYSDPGASLTPAEVVNPLVDACLAAIKPPAGHDRQTLGGLVDDVFVHGELLTDEGLLQDITYVSIPIHVIFTAF